MPDTWTSVQRFGAAGIVLLATAAWQQAPTIFDAALAEPGQRTPEVTTAELRREPAATSTMPAATLTNADPNDVPGTCQQLDARINNTGVYDDYGNNHPTYEGWTTPHFSVGSVTELGTPVISKNGKLTCVTITQQVTFLTDPKTKQVHWIPSACNRCACSYEVGNWEAQVAQHEAKHRSDDGRLATRETLRWRHRQFNGCGRSESQALARARAAAKQAQNQAIANLIATEQVWAANYHAKPESKTQPPTCGPCEACGPGRSPHDCLNCETCEKGECRNASCGNDGLHGCCVLVATNTTVTPLEPYDADIPNVTFVTCEDQMLDLAASGFWITRWQFIYGDCPPPEIGLSKRACRMRLAERRKAFYGGSIGDALAATRP